MKKKKILYICYQLTPDSIMKLRNHYFNVCYNTIRKSGIEMLYDILICSHCTILHKNQITKALKEEDYNTFIEAMNVIKLAEKVVELDNTIKLQINSFGFDNKVCAYRVVEAIRNISIGEEFISFNDVPHITAATYNGGKPVDSNRLIYDRDIKPIFVDTKIKIVYER